MRLIEHIRRGKALIARGRSYGKNTNALEAEVKSLLCRIEVEVRRLKLSEFAKLDLAVQIYSEFLRCTLWFCSNDKMASQIRKELPGSVCYTVDDLRYLISLDPSPEDLNNIHETKRIFTNSKIKGSVINDDYESSKEKGK